MDEDEQQPRTRVDVVTKLLVLRMHQARPELTAAELGELCGASESSVRRLLALQTANRKELIQQLLVAGAPAAVEDWERARRISADRGYFQAAREWLIAAELIDAKPTLAANVNVAPQVILQMPFGLGALKDYRPDAPLAIEVTRVEPAVLPVSTIDATHAPAPQDLAPPSTNAPRRQQADQ